MSKLTQAFLEIRKVSTPWTIVRTHDYMATIKTLLGVKVSKDEDKPAPAVLWTCTNGCQSPIYGNAGIVISETVQEQLGSQDDPPFIMLKNAREMLPQDSILFMVSPDDSLLGNTFTIQAISDLRDAFKATRRTLVILGKDPKLPPFLSEDIPVLDDPLPNVVDLIQVTKDVFESAGVPLTGDFAKQPEQAAKVCLGMTQFAAEEAIARKLRRTGINFPELALSQMQVVEESTNKALTFERETWTFQDIGGLQSFKEFMGLLFAGPRKPSVVVRIDEIDKSINASSSGAVADNTGVSQDILKCLLTSLEDNKWMGLLACGGPGTGKTIASICTGNEFGVRTLSLDLGAVKGSLVGESEGKIRRVVDVLKTIGGRDVMFIATANRLDTMPPELQRRFWLGTWFWDLPEREEKKQIWKIQRNRFKIKESDLEPDDEGWTGSDIRNACQMSFVTGIPLIQATEYVTLAGRTSKQQIETLRTLAEASGFRSANYTGAYKKPTLQGKSRKMGAL